MYKVAFVSGASRGIGRAIATSLAKEGYHLGLVCRKNQKMLEDLAEDLRFVYHIEVLTFTGDVGDPSFVKALAEEMLAHFSQIDVLVNNAGITKDMLLMRMTEEQFDDVINTNLKGTFNMIRHASSVMLKQRSGAIINMASVVGINGNIGQANYAASKAGIIGLTKSTAKELASRGVTCNAIAPGFVETDMTAVLKEDVQEAILNAIPLKRAGKVEDIARAAVFLAENNYITGQVLNVDGGMVM